MPSMSRLTASSPSTQGLDRNSDEYRQLKAARAKPLYDAIEVFIPDVKVSPELTTHLMATRLPWGRHLGATW